MADRIKSLEMRGIIKRFPGILASNNINIKVEEGEILALIGENGAGKTALMNILMGIYQPDSGQIIINGKEVHFRGPDDAFKAGLGMVHQRYMLIPGMTVLENIALAIKEAHKFFKLDLNLVRKRIEETSERYGLSVNPDAFVWQLSVGEQQRVELVKTLCLGARFLILDEPTSALTPQEIDELIVLLKKMKKELSIIFISHKLHEVKALCDKVTILRAGTVVFSGSTSDYSPSQMAAMMTGHEVILPTNKEEVTHNDLALSIRDLKVKSDRGYYSLNGLNLDVHNGEIVGLAGVSGNGQKELAAAINGLRGVESGEILFLGEDIANLSANEIIKRGMGYIPEERNIEGIVNGLSIRENIILKDSDTPKFSKGPFLKTKHILENALHLKDRFDIRCAHIEVDAGSLSGGNIQKVILARELSRKPKFLIAVYPTRGLDLGAVSYIHELLLQIRREGIGILFISEELDDLINLSDRIAVIYKGQIQKVFNRGEATRQRLGIYMAGVKEDE